MRPRFATVMAAAMLALMGAAPLWAQMGNPWQAFSGLPNGQKWDSFVRHHPQVARELQSNPNLLWNPDWRRHHPELREWIHYHQPLWNRMMASQGVSPYQQKWEQFLAGHSGLSKQLQNNPNLLYNPAWRSKHPELAEFLAQHPNVRNSLWSSAPAGMYPSTFGNFASNHPGLMQQLNANPGLAVDPGYLRQHPDFADFMRDHPGFREDMEERAEYWRHHHSYDGWRWRHAWNDPDAAPWIPPGLRHSHGHAYGWYAHHAGYAEPDADDGPYPGPGWHGEGHHPHGHGDWDRGPHGHRDWDHGPHGRGNWDHGPHGHGDWDHDH
jgi:hypothetical protein